jgi:hypothetical protein
MKFKFDILISMRSEVTEVPFVWVAMQFVPSWTNISLTEQYARYVYVISIFKAIFLGLVD